VPAAAVPAAAVPAAAVLAAVVPVAAVPAAVVPVAAAAPSAAAASAPIPLDPVSPRPLPAGAVPMAAVACSSHRVVTYTSTPPSAAARRPAIAAPRRVAATTSSRPPALTGWCLDAVPAVARTLGAYRPNCAQTADSAFLTHPSNTAGGNAPSRNAGSDGRRGMRHQALYAPPRPQCASPSSSYAPPDPVWAKKLRLAGGPEPPRTARNVSRRNPGLHVGEALFGGPTHGARTNAVLRAEHLAWPPDWDGAS
jgi:hypothetical protein